MVLSFKSEGKWKTFPDKENLRPFYANEPISRNAEIGWVLAQPLKQPAWQS